ncbi:hypothetical protein ES288_D07G099500v1 [Gossypium darwinii]|uniref:Uncharacterized protein n=1 Tax=Gossypium darwinii TaxID=34276 RepID=A0A5D2BUA9_GOSDA|nr:hypothetical protein ES288_D07G099500v1 [Gossypium darwinii]
MLMNGRFDFAKSSFQRITIITEYKNNPLYLCRASPTHDEEAAAKAAAINFDSSTLRELNDQSTSVLHSYHDSGAMPRDVFNTLPPFSCGL